jgi:hypothetical protein
MWAWRIVGVSDSAARAAQPEPIAIAAMTATRIASCFMTKYTGEGAE